MPMPPVSPLPFPTEEASGVRRRLRRLGAALVCITALLASSSASAQTAPGRDYAAEGTMLASINQQRAAAGLAPLTLDASMSQAATGWTVQMVNGNFLAHSSDITSGAPSASKNGENVGRAQSVDALAAAFMTSSAHRANIMDPSYTHVGIAAYWHPFDGRLYTTHRFAALPAAAPPAASVPALPADDAPQPEADDAPQTVAEVPIEPTSPPIEPTATPVPATPTPLPVDPGLTFMEPTPIPSPPEPNPTPIELPLDLVTPTASEPTPVPTATVLVPNPVPPTPTVLVPTPVPTPTVLLPTPPPPTPAPMPPAIEHKSDAKVAKIRRGERSISD